MKLLKELFQIEKKPFKGLFAYEWAMVGYLLLTLLIILFCFTKVQNPEAMIWGRVRIVAITAALYAVYRMLPCRFTRFARAVLQLALLSWWYPDTYEINRMFPNLDHLFASCEQHLFGCQPALLFSQALPGRFFSELMDMGYASYFPMIVVVVAFYFLRRYQEFSRVTFIVLTSFFIYYVIFILVPVTGPQYYFGAAGLENIAQGVFPNIHDYFNHTMERLSSPGWKDGFFYQHVAAAHDAGERPTAAFPSSHVGISTILMLLSWRTGCRRLFWCLLPFYVCLCVSTVYIMAHYVIDTLAGLVSGVIIFYVLLAATRTMKSSLKS